MSAVGEKEHGEAMTAFSHLFCVALGAFIAGFIAGFLGRNQKWNVCAGTVGAKVSQTVERLTWQKTFLVIFVALSFIFQISHKA